MQKKNHQQILGDLLEIRNRAAEVWQKIGVYSNSSLLFSICGFNYFIRMVFEIVACRRLETSCSWWSNRFRFNDQSATDKISRMIFSHKFCIIFNYYY